MSHLNCRIISEYTIAAVIAVSSIIVLAVIIHLSCVYVQKRKEQKSKRNKIQFFLLLTIITLIFYELSLILLIVVFVQIILIDDHVMDQYHGQHVAVTHHVYYSSFESLEYLNAIFNETGHLGVMLVFVVRFHGTFYNSLLSNNKRMITALYLSIFILFLAAILVLVMMLTKQSIEQILIVEFVWDIVVHTMWLWVLYLFISKLYSLLNMSLQSHTTDGKIHSSLIKSLIEATKISDNRHPNVASKNKSNDPKSMYTHTMIIDGIKVELNSTRNRCTTPCTSRNASRETSPEASPDPSVQSATVKTNATECQPSGCGSNTEHGGIEGQSAAMDLIGVMTKMTILVVFTVLISILCGIGCGVMEMKEMEQDHSGQDHVDTIALWSEIFPVIDSVFSCLMLYLQFNFTHKIYRFVFRRFDAWFLRNWLRVMEYLARRQLTNDDPKSASFLATTNTTTTETT
eukprot:228385_1